jgi:Helitron helicase-like domain at N-terminus
MVCQNPVAAARFFHFIVQTFITDVLGVNSTHKGIFGDISAYYGSVEQQGRLALHLHILLWILGSLNPLKMREQILHNKKFAEKIINYLEGCHTGDFFESTFDKVSDYVKLQSQQSNYIDPTQSLPVPPPQQCKNHLNKENLNCNSCEKYIGWWEHLKITVNDLLFKSNVHSCSHNINKDGSRKKKSFKGCMDNIWGKCKARFPQPLFTKTTINKETGAIDMAKSESWLNTFTPIITYLF